MNSIFRAALLTFALNGVSTVAIAAPAHQSKAAAVKAAASKSFSKVSAPVVQRMKRAQSASVEVIDNAKALSDKAREVVMYSLMLLQTGYVWGGKTPEDGLDCSGLVTHVFNEAADIPLEGNSATLATKGTRVARHQLRSGDLVFFNTMNRKFSHVGIYLGDGNFVHSPNKNGVVRVESITTPYWSKRFEMARTLHI